VQQRIVITIDPLGFKTKNKHRAVRLGAHDRTRGQQPDRRGGDPRLGYAVAANSGDTPNGTASIIDYNHFNTPDTAAVVPIITTSGTTTTTSILLLVGLAPRAWQSIRTAPWRWWPTSDQTPCLP